MVYEASAHEVTLRCTVCQSSNLTYDQVYLQGPLGS
jgi:hypothetical protein